MKKDLPKILAGTAAGMALGVAAGKYLESEEGKKKKEEIKKKLNEFYSYAEDRIKEMRSRGREKYLEEVSLAAAEYGKIKELTEEEVEALIDKTMTLWDKFSSK